LKGIYVKPGKPWFLTTGSKTLKYCPTFKAGYTFWNSVFKNDRMLKKNKNEMPVKPTVSL